MIKHQGEVLPDPAYGALLSHEAHPLRTALIREKHRTLANDEGYHSMPSIVLSVLGLFSQLILIL